jgi:hypothetical protein
MDGAMASARARVGATALVVVVGIAVYGIAPRLASRWDVGSAITRVHWWILPLLVVFEAAM